MINKIGASSASINQGDSVLTIRQQLKQLYSPEHFRTADQKNVKTLVTKLLKLTQGIPSRDIVDELLAHDFKEIQRFPEDAFIHSPIVEATLDALDEKSNIDDDDPLKILLNESLQNWLRNHSNTLFKTLCSDNSKIILRHKGRAFKLEHDIGQLVLDIHENSKSRMRIIQATLADLKNDNPYKLPSPVLVNVVSHILLCELLQKRSY